MEMVERRRELHHAQVTPVTVFSTVQAANISAQGNRSVCLPVLVSRQLSGKVVQCVLSLAARAIAFWVRTMQNLPAR